MGQAFDLVSEFQDSEEVLLFSELFLLLNLCAQVIDKIFKVRECLLSEILGRWRVLLNTLQVLDRLERLLSLLIDDGGESVILLGDLLDDLFDDDHVTENDFFDVLEMNDFYNVLNLYQDDPEDFDDLFEETDVSNFLNTCNTVC